jgi:hypothetical protein
MARLGRALRVAWLLGKIAFIVLAAAWVFSLRVSVWYYINPNSAVILRAGAITVYANLFKRPTLTTQQRELLRDIVDNPLSIHWHSDPPQWTPEFHSQNTPRRWWIGVLPLWIPLAACATPFVVGWLREGRLRTLLKSVFQTKPSEDTGGRCVECGYDLTGNVSGRCPECGQAVGEDARRHTRSTTED